MIARSRRPAAATNREYALSADENQRKVIHVCTNSNCGNVFDFILAEFSTLSDKGGTNWDHPPTSVMSLVKRHDCSFSFRTNADSRLRQTTNAGNGKRSPGESRTNFTPKPSTNPRD